MAVRAARAADEKQARDIKVLNVGDLIGITEFFVLASAATERQVRAVADAVEEELRKAGAKPVRREGVRDLRWLLLDFGDIVVHVFTDEEREFYDIERLWKDAPAVKWEPTAKKDATPARAAAQS